MVAENLMIASQAYYIFYTEQTGSENIGLNRQPVPVPAGHLHYRLDSHIQRQFRRGYTGNAYYGCLIVGYIDGIDPAF